MVRRDRNGDDRLDFTAADPSRMAVTYKGYIGSIGEYDDTITTIADAGLANTDS